MMGSQILISRNNLFTCPLSQQTDKHFFNPSVMKRILFSQLTNNNITITVKHVTFKGTSVVCPQLTLRNLLTMFQKMHLQDNRKQKNKMTPR